MKDLAIEVVGRSKEALSLGAHLGNRFAIVIRDADPEDYERARERGNALHR